MKRPLIVLFALGLTFWLGCSRSIVNKPVSVTYNRGQDTNVLNSDKSIDSFVIMAADNPTVLSSDVKGSIFFDTVRLWFNTGTDVSNLIPTIGIIGKTINPASKTPENFANTVHYIVTAEDGSILNYYVAAYFR